MNLSDLKVAIVLLNYRSKKETVECLESLEKIKNEITAIIVDNSPTESRDFIKEKIKEIKKFNVELIKSDVNTGFSGGNNIGIHHALANGYDYVLILNNDTVVDENFLSNLLLTAEKDKKVGAVVPKIYFAKGHEFHKKRYKKEELGKVIWYAGGIIDWKNVIGLHRGVDEVDKGQYDKTLETEYATGACMLLKKEAIEDVGMFDEDFFLYYEDSDLSMRMKKKGYKILFEPSSFIWHKNASSTGGSGSTIQDYYTTRNRMLFGMRYAPIRSKIALIRESIHLFVKGRPFQKRGIKDYYLKEFGKGIFDEKN